MKELRTSLHPGEYLEHGLPLPRHIILGECHGVILHPRSGNERAVLVTALIEDDGQWFVSKSKTGFSSFWLPDLMRVLQAAEEWMNANCIKYEWGWKFRPKGD